MCWIRFGLVRGFRVLCVAHSAESMCLLAYLLVYALVYLSMSLFLSLFLCLFQSMPVCLCTHGCSHVWVQVCACTGCVRRIQLASALLDGRTSPRCSTRSAFGARSPTSVAAPSIGRRPPPSHHAPHRAARPRALARRRRCAASCCYPCLRTSARRGRARRCACMRVSVSVSVSRVKPKALCLTTLLHHYPPMALAEVNPNAEQTHIMIPLNRRLSHDCAPPSESPGLYSGTAFGGDRPSTSSSTMAPITTTHLTSRHQVLAGQRRRADAHVLYQQVPLRLCPLRLLAHRGGG